MGSLLLNREELEGRYPDVDLGRFVPTHRVHLVLPATKELVRLDYVRLGAPEENGIRFGFVPGDTEPVYGVLSTGLWQCLDKHGRVKAEVIKYVPDYVKLKDRNGFVYFVQRGEDGPIKIGWSQNVARRIGELQVANAEHLSLLGAIPGTMRDETKTHKRFTHLRINAEWFQGCEEIVEYVRNFGGVEAISLT